MINDHEESDLNEFVGDDDGDDEDDGDEWDLVSQVSRASETSTLRNLSNISSIWEYFDKNLDIRQIIMFVNNALKNKGPTRAKKWEKRLNKSRKNVINILFNR